MDGIGREPKSDAFPRETNSSLKRNSENRRREAMAADSRLADFLDWAHKRSIRADGVEIRSAGEVSALIGGAI